MADTPIEYVDDVTCRETWADTIQVMFAPGGAIKIEFCVQRYTREPPVVADRTSPVARVVMTPDLAHTLQQHLEAQLADLRQKIALAQTSQDHPH